MPDPETLPFRRFVLAFPALVVGQCALFYMLPILALAFTVLAIAIYGLALSVVALLSLATYRDVPHVRAAAIVTLTGLFWLYVPTREMAIDVRFWLERYKYEQAVAEASLGEEPRCVATQECIYAGKQLVFPYPGMLFAWVGIVHVPDPRDRPDLQSLRSVASAAACDPNPISGSYYACAFW